MKNFRVFFVILTILCPIIISSQVKLKELPSSNANEVENLLFGKSGIRKVMNLEKGWKIYPLDNPKDAEDISVPSNFEGEATLVYEKVLNFTPEEYNNFKFHLHFLGANYYSEILINNFVIYKNSTDIPFDVELPKDLIKPGFNNVLSIKVSFKLDSENTIPFKQRFLGPKNLGGLIRNVLLEYVPNRNVDLVNFGYNFDSNSRAKLTCNVKVDLSKKGKDSTNLSGDYKVVISLTGKDKTSADYRQEYSVNYSKNAYSVDLGMEVVNPEMWRPENPNYYFLKIQLISGGQIIDESEKTISFYNLSISGNKVLLNGNDYLLTGTTYHISNSYYGNIISLYNLKQELTTIKNIGFNSVRFAQAVPNPIALRLCEEIGLFAFIELPINSLPGEYAQNTSFMNQAKNFLNLFLDRYNSYSAICAVGVGSSYSPDSKNHESMIQAFAETVRNRTNKLIYASFIGWPTEKVSGLDLYGVELFGKPIKSLGNSYAQSAETLGKARIFISEATYPVYKGVSSGYINDFSSEGQARYFSDLVDFALDNGIGGYFINSLFDYAGDFSSLFTSYDPAKDYNVGILGKDKNEFLLPYKVLFSKLHDNEKVTIPIGTKKDDSKIFFILIALGLSVLLAALINTKRKFREDCSRALIRPYNFFADIRDHRILSGVHASILMVVVLGTLALLCTIVLYFLKSNILLEKILLSFGSRRIISFVSYLAWNPIQAFVILFVLLSLKFGIGSFLVKVASFFIKTKVPIQNIMFMIIWAMLPVVLLIPVELLLYKVLTLNAANLYIYIFLALFLLWILQRTLKGIYVIFDVRPFTVYFYSILFIFLLIGGIVLYYQFSNSAIYFIINAFKQSSLI
jgi:beta-galactosidase